MIKPAITLLVALALLVPLSAETNWTPIAARVEKSIVMVESAAGSCTGFAIDNNRDYVLTANHCFSEKELTADGAPAEVIYKDIKTDLLVVRIVGMDRPALKLAKDDPAIGEPVMSYGYGYALDRPLARFSHISDNKTYIPEGGIGGPFMVTDATFVPGQSGGPVVNATGDVVMIVQLGNNAVGIGRGADLLRKKVGRFFTLTSEK